MHSYWAASRSCCSGCSGPAESGHGALRTLPAGHTPDTRDSRHDKRARARVYTDTPTGPRGAAAPDLAALGTHLQDLEGAHERLVDRHHAAGVVELATVVGRREQRHQLPLGEELVPVLHHLAIRQGDRECEQGGNHYCS